ncbi:MAG TPA: aldehyde dehydrogenase family protein [Rhodospirillales bacterium]|nr:aldehyde dehydrogenase family protein [Rhodospirillales bacterium]
MSETGRSESRGRCLIGGRWVAPASGETLPVICPSDGKVFAEIASGGAADIDAAVKAARRARESGAWGRLPAFERGRLLMRLGEAILDHAEELAALESRDTGKPLRQGRADIRACARYFEYYGGAADKLHGDTIPFLEGYTAATFWEPHGVTAHIIPWNYPAQIFGRSVGAALAAGNACVLKPAEDACLSLLRIGELALEIGLPEGALNIVPGLGEEAGAALAAHPGIDFISFTGSPETGTAVQAAAARNHVGCTLELGGKSPQILFADADLEAALPVVVAAIVQNAGQTCSAGSRVLIERGIYEEVTERLAARFRELVAGPHDRDLDLGALINRTQMERVRGYLEEARARGIPVLAEGRIVEDAPTGGYYVAPVLLGPVPPEERLACEEVFGPVLACLPFAGEAEALAIANATPYGLVAGVWTRDGGRQLRMAHGIRAGQVFLNGYGAGGGIELPFGGVGRSGHGREKGFAGLYEFVRLKTVVWNHGRAP